MVAKLAKKPITKAVICLVLAVIVFLGAILGGGSVVFGWFTMGAKTTDLGAVSGSVTDSVLSAAYTVYAYDVDFAKAYTHYLDNAGDPTANAVEIDNISLSAYDRTFSVNNPYTPVVIRISVSNAYIPAEGTISVRLQRNSVLTGSATNNFDDSTAQARLSKRCSSVMRFALIGDAAVMTAADDGAGNINATTLYNTVRTSYYNQMQSGAIGQTFVTKNGADTYDKAEQITLSLHYTPAMWNGSTLNLYLYVTYDAAMIGDYLAQNILVGGDNGTDTLENDLTKLILIQSEVTA